MKPKTLVLMAVAITCGLLASYMTSRIISERNQKVDVLVARQECPQWRPIDDPDKLFEVRSVLKTEAPMNHVPAEQAAELKSRVFGKQLAQGQTVTWADLQDKNKMFLDIGMKEGMRAFAIEASARTAVAGFVLPGSRVDVIQTRRDVTGTKSRFVLEDLLVRGVDQHLDRPPEKGGLVPSTITLEVTPEEVLKLSEAASSGQLSLALRGVDDRSRAHIVTPLPPEIPPAIIQATPEPVELPTDKFYQTSFDGHSWRRAEYILNKEGQVISSRYLDGPGEPASPRIDAP